MKEKGQIYNTAVIDGQTVKVGHGQTILDAAIKAGIYIPTLCHLEILEPYGGCRLCVVEVKGMKGFPTACTTPLASGMEVVTVSPELQKLRREILEFTLSEHPYTCLVCKDKKECTDFMHSTRKVSTITGCNFCTSNGDCELQDLVEFLDLDDIKFPITYRSIPPVKDNPFYDLDYNLCILCGRCVRICNEERNSHVLAFVERGHTAIVGTAFGESQTEAGCEFCGSCVDVCPTGSISEKMGKWRGLPDRSVKTSCVICPVACDMNVNTRNGKIVQIGPSPGKRTGPPQLCLRGKFLPAEINDHPSRITKPLIKRDNKWLEVSWEKAFETIAKNLDKHGGSKFGIIASGQDTMEDNYMLQEFSRKVMHSNNVDIHGSYPDREIPGLLHQLRMRQITAGPAQIEKADTLLLIGTDASVSHPLLENRIRKAFRKGKKVICFGPTPTRTSTFVTTELLYQPGSEEPFLLLLLSALVEQKNREEDIRAAETLAEIRISDLEPVRSLLSDSGEVAIIAGDDLLRQSRARNIIQMLSSLHAAISQNHSCRIVFPGYEGNLYSSALAGAHPGYLPGFHPVKKGTSGMNCNEMVRQSGKDGIAALMLVGDLPPYPGLKNLGFMVQCNMFKTGASEYADVLLPLPDFLESEGHILSMDNKLKKVTRAVTPPGNVRSIAGIVSGLAKVMGKPGFGRKPAEIIRELKPFLKTPGQDSRDASPLNLKPFFKEIGQKRPEKQNGYPVRLMLLYNHFRYRGNRLISLVPDLGSISHEGTVGLSDFLMEKLKVKEGDSVRVISENGTVDAMARSIPGLNSQIACLCPNGSNLRELHDEVYPEKQLVHVKIEKV